MNKSMFLFVILLSQFSSLCFAEKALYYVNNNKVNFTQSKECPPENVLSKHREIIKEDISSAINQVINPILSNRYGDVPCSCGGPGWKKVASLNMSDPNQNCPSSWNLRTDTVRGCGGFSSADSVNYGTPGGSSYNKVCGRIIAYQFGTPEAFYPISQGLHLTLDCAYIGGVSVTHGRPGFRQHIWSFVAAMTDKNITDSRVVCPCTLTDQQWPYQVYPFVENNYFCETGRHTYDHNHYIVFDDDPLWDGKGCPSHSSCCRFNNPP